MDTTVSTRNNGEWLSQKGEITMMYFRSVYTGHCMECDFIPQYGGWELITREEFLDWKRSIGI